MPDQTRSLCYGYDSVVAGQLTSGLVHLQGDDGVAVINFPQRAKGTRDFILLDEDMQVTVGNRGSVVIVQRK